jgi:ribonuclease HI
MHEKLSAEGFVPAEVVTIYSDGSCNNHDKNRGGYGLVVIRGEEVRQYCGGSYFNTTSARMEILGAIQALKKVEVGEIVEVFIDNEYVVNALDKRWVFNWERTNFRGKKNVDLWKRFLIEYRRLYGKVKLTWIRGHDGNYFNELADALASMGANKELQIKDRQE